MKMTDAEIRLLVDLYGLTAAIAVVDADINNWYDAVKLAANLAR